MARRAPWWMFVIAAAFLVYFALNHYDDLEREAWAIAELVEKAPQLVALIVAVVIAFGRPYDLVARLGGWFMATAAVYTFDPSPGMAAAWRNLPLLLGGLLWIPQISILLFPQILFTFFAVFPHNFFGARWMWILVWAPAIPELTRVAPISRMVYYPDRPIHLPGWLWFVIDFSFPAFIIGGLVVLIVNYLRLKDLNERRRVRVMVIGSVVGWLAVLPEILFPSFFSSAGWSWVLIMLLFATCPLSFAYAILRHRLFDIRVMIRQGLQYALARRLVLSFVPLMAVVLLVDLLMHGEQPLVAIVGARGWVYLLLGALAVAAHAQRQRWLEVLDRRFFRERYDAQRLLGDVVEEVRQTRSLEWVAPRLVARIEAALHPEFAALMVRHPQEPSYRSLASAPAGHAPPPLPAEGKLVALLRLLGKPMEVSLTQTSWLDGRLPHEETGFLRQARIELLVPVATTAEHAEALLALGPKRSEEPYTREDQDLLAAIAASLALLLEKPAAPPAHLSEAFEECPQCGACYDTGTQHCEREGTRLIVMYLPRLLAGRYRVERHLGTGGMGTVYEASDTALERRVAVKMIRDELLASAEAADRFRREARLAASFAHPNVVTVYDFGIVGGTRAFLVMELLAGTTLRDELKRQQRLPAARVVEILGGVCAAVDAAHRRHLIHRDLKPENIFLVRQEETEIAKVLDFGLAKFLPNTSRATSDTRTGYLIGTLRYIAPEQLRGEAAQPAWDIWALAVVAYEMLTGAGPFAGETAGKYYSAVLGGVLTPVTAHLPEAPARWQDFFIRALALDEQKRPNSARAFFSALEKTLC